jgi:two-component system LytT family response regulator
MKLKAIIIEDEFNARQALKNMLEFYHPEIELIGESASVKDSVALLEKAAPDLLFMDVRLPDGESFEIFRNIKARGFQIIFITAYDEYALPAIKLSALDYLLKPVKPRELNLAIEKALKSRENEELMDMKIDTCVSNFNSSGRPRKIIINTTEKMHVINTQDIVRCEARENYTDIHLIGDERIIAAKTLKELEEMLTPYGFYRIHHSHLINMHYVKAFEKRSAGAVLLSNGQHIPVSNRRKEGFIKGLQQFF